MAGKHLVTIYSKKGLALQFKKGVGRTLYTAVLTRQKWLPSPGYSELMALGTSQAFKIFSYL